MGNQLEYAIGKMYRAKAFSMLRAVSLEFKDVLWDRNTDPRLRAFLWASIMESPENDWTLTGMRRKPGKKPSGHAWAILSAFDLRSKTWSLEQLHAYYNWYKYWWKDKPDMIDLIIEDERFDVRYKSGGEKNKNGKLAPHIHMEISERKYWR